MPDTQLLDVLQDLNDLRADLVQQGFQGAQSGLKQFLAAIETPPLSFTLAGLLPQFDYGAWRGETQATRQLTWPFALPDRVACRVEICRECGTVDIGWLKFMYDYRTVEGNYDVRFREFVGLVIDPFLRDLAKLLQRHRAPAPIDRLLTTGLPPTGDDQLDALVRDALVRFTSPDAVARKVALERLWDAWERLKTLHAANKPAGVQQLIHDATAETAIREALNSEARALTDLGNGLQIRHFERQTTPIPSSMVVDYLFYRMFALMWLLTSPFASQS